MSDYRIGDEVYIHGFVDEVRKDVVIIKNEGGYFGTVADEIIPSAQPEPLKITIDHAPTADELERIKQAMRITPVIVFPSAHPEPSEITDEQAIMHLQSTGWMQNHDREMYESGLRERLADDSDSYDALLPSAQHEEDCDTCKHGYFGDDQCNNCRVRYPSHYERRTDE